MEEKRIFSIFLILDLFIIPQLKLDLTEPEVDMHVLLNESFRPKSRLINSILFLSYGTANKIFLNHEAVLGC